MLYLTADFSTECVKGVDHYSSGGQGTNFCEPKFVSATLCLVIQLEFPFFIGDCIFGTMLMDIFFRWTIFWP